MRPRAIAVKKPMKATLVASPLTPPRARSPPVSPEAPMMAAIGASVSSPTS